MPTRGQIETICERSWERALELARLQPRARAAEAPVAIIEALLRFYEAEGYLPSEVELAEATRGQGLTLERAAGRGWPDLVEEAKQEASRRGLPNPPPYGTRPAAGREDAQSRAGGEGPATKGFYTRAQVLERVREFDAELPAATSATDKQWREFQRGRAGVPSLNVVRRHGGLRELLREASRPDWRERAEEWDRPVGTYS